MQTIKQNIKYKPFLPLLPQSAHDRNCSGLPSRLHSAVAWHILHTAMGVATGLSSCTRKEKEKRNKTLRNQIQNCHVLHRLKTKACQSSCIIYVYQPFKKRLKQNIFALPVVITVVMLSCIIFRIKVFKYIVLQLTFFNSETFMPVGM